MSNIVTYNTFPHSGMVNVSWSLLEGLLLHHLNSYLGGMHRKMRKGGRDALPVSQSLVE